MITNKPDIDMNHLKVRYFDMFIRIDDKLLNPNTRLFLQPYDNNFKLDYMFVLLRNVLRNT